MEGGVLVGTGAAVDSFESGFTGAVVDTGGAALGEAAGMVVGVLGLLAAVELGPGDCTGFVSS